MDETKRISELEASRARILAAADDARRRIERALHDGVQQRLVTLSLEARLAAEQASQDGSPDLHDKLRELADSLDRTFEQLREVARTIHPAVLSHGGLPAALRSLARGAEVPVELELPEAGPLPEPVALSAYYIVAEAMSNADRHAQATKARIRAEVIDDHLEVEVSDDGIGGADPAGGSGLVSLADRAQALGGTLDLSSPAGQGTTLLARLPLSAPGSG
jgi:signal transduction histidine kinase